MDNVEQLDKMEFSYNWNGKLNCEYFTTIRLSNPQKFFPGKKFLVYLESSKIKVVQVVQVQTKSPYDFTETECYLDTGYGKKKTMEMLQKMYQGKLSSVNTSLFNIVLVKTIQVLKNPKQLGFEFE